MPAPAPSQQREGRRGVAAAAALAARTIACLTRPPQGVGKGTYATRVSDAFGLCHIAAGDLVREEMRKGSELGHQVRGGQSGAGSGAVGGGRCCPAGRAPQPPTPTPPIHTHT